MEKRIFKNSIYNAIAGQAKAFGHANRLEILDLLANGEKTVEQVATQTDITVANASHHLQLLKNARLVKSRRDGNFIFYALNGRKAYAAWKALRELALEAEPTVQLILQQYRGENNSASSVSKKGSAPAGDLLLLDVRPSGEFEAGHLPDAVSIPLEELPQRLGELPRQRTIGAYCRGVFCTFADEAVQLLRANGFKAVRLDETFLDFKLLTDDSWKN